MTKEEMKRLHLTPIEGLINEDFGEIGSPSRMEFSLFWSDFVTDSKWIKA